MSRQKFGLLKYSTSNLGDEIQSIAARRFLPAVDAYVDREFLHRARSETPLKVILNGWFMHSPRNWPPSPDIVPLFVSFHISPEAAGELTRPESLQYLRRHEPIGCRDCFTRDLLLEKGVHAYFSGCLTLTLTPPDAERAEETVLVDIPAEMVRRLPRTVRESAVTLSHSPETTTDTITHGVSRGLRGFSPAVHRIVSSTGLHLALRRASMSRRLRDGDTRAIRRLERANRLLERYARAKLVITTRLHCALPCVAFGTPVLLVTESPHNPRLSDLLQYVRHCPADDLERAIADIGADRPRPNPPYDTDVANRLRETCLAFVRDA